MDLERTDKTSRRVKTFEGDDVAHEAGGAKCHGRSVRFLHETCENKGASCASQALTAEFKAKVQEAKRTVERLPFCRFVFCKFLDTMLTGRVS